MSFAPSYYGSRVAAATVAICFSAVPVWSQQVSPIDHPMPVVRLALAGGVGNGFTAAGAVLAQTDDGNWFEITPDGLIAAAPPATADSPSDAVTDSAVTAAGATRAWLSGATQRYAHGILGDATEAAALTMQHGDAQPVSFVLPPDSVFEDLRVRLVDLNDDGAVEAVVVRSYVNAGSALAVFSLFDGQVGLLDETPPIGRSSRWLNPAGAADFDGDGAIEVAYVETPHIGGTLRYFQLTAEGLVQDFAAPGFSNHAIGSREQGLAAVVDWNRDGVVDLAVPDAQRRSLRVVTIAGGEGAQLASIANPAAIATAIFPLPESFGPANLVYGLEDGSLWRVSP